MKNRRKSARFYCRPKGTASMWKMYSAPTGSPMLPATTATGSTPIGRGKDYHTGVDIGMAQGTDILAGHDGRVTPAGNAGGYGLCIAIEGEAYEGHTLTTKYGHCSRFSFPQARKSRPGM